MDFLSWTFFLGPSFSDFLGLSQGSMYNYSYTYACTGPVIVELDSIAKLEFHHTIVDNLLTLSLSASSPDFLGCSSPDRSFPVSRRSFGVPPVCEDSDVIIF